MNGPDARRRKPSLAGFGLPQDAQDKQDKRDKDARRDEARAKQKIDAPRATADYRAAEQSVRDRTAALREARRAREKAGDKEPE
jgi:hypothetical protein